MGIQGLLPYVQTACRKCDVTEFRGRTIAVDAYCWLHRGVFGCADEVILGQQTDKYIHYCMKYVNSLVSNGIKVILVFDGARLPAKKETNDSRRQQRELAREKGHRMLAAGNHSEASGYFRQGVDITSEMVGNVIQACLALNSPNVKCIVAPYEADAQLAYLNLNGFADVILAEDSDLILFGCTKILFKFDQYRGDLYELDELPKATKLDFITFRRMCILSGCDYFNGLPGFGLKKSTQFFQKVVASSTRDIKKCLKRIPSVTNNNKIKITDVFVEQFVAAENTFLHQLVYDPVARKLVPLNPYPAGIHAEIMPYAGRLVEDHIAAAIASGYLCPHSHRRREGFTTRSDISVTPVKKRRTPMKSPARSMSKSPKKKPIAAFEMGHVRNVVRFHSPKKTVSLEQSFGRSAVTMYDSGINQSMTRSRYFSVTSSAISEYGDDTDGPQLAQTPVASKLHSSISGIRKKRSCFDSLGESGNDDDQSGESGFFDSNGSFSTSTPTLISPGAKRISIRKDYSFRTVSKDPQELKSPLLASFNGTLSQFRYRQT